VLVEKHSDDDSEKPADLRHGSSFLSSLPTAHNHLAAEAAGSN